MADNSSQNTRGSAAENGAGAATTVTPAERALTRAEWQPVLFADAPRRHDLLRLEASWPLREVTVRVHRNHPFEYVASAAAPFLAFGGYHAAFDYTAYDDALTLAVDGVVDLEVVWLDFERYDGQGAEELAAWLGGRLEALRAASDAPVLVADAAGPGTTALNAALSRVTAPLPGVHLCPLSDVHQRLGERYFDPRMEKIAATRMSDAAAIGAARGFGAWIPAAVSTPLKAIVLDLDHTLYRGVLGEDGADGIELTQGHRALQAWLAEQKKEGVFLGLCSRNEASDVAAMFAARRDFPLGLDDFSATAISWDSKSDGIARIAAELRIGLDAILFVDDNPGELAAVATALPALELLHAEPAAERTLIALDNYPGLLRWEQSDTDRLRVADLAADRERRSAQAAGTVDDYLASLQVRLSLRMDPDAESGRLHDISNKTNQFNTGFQRFSASEVARRLTDPESRIVSIHLRDRLSDSGSVGAVYAHREDGRLVVDEIAVSCRALGRHLEDVMLAEALRRILDELPAERIVLHYAYGARNEPARKWLGGFVGESLGEGLDEEPRELEMPADPEELRRRAQSKPVEIVWEIAD